MSLLRNTFAVLVFALVVLCAAVAQEKRVKLCGERSTSANAVALSDTGGIYMTATGTLRVLLVFASFLDDTIPHPYWQRHQPPMFMRQFIDPDTLTRSSSPFNLTNYFRQMSLGKFNLIGEAIWIESTHSQEEYREGAYGRANKHLLQEQADPLVDFTQYDQWTKVADYHHTNAPDGLVDMIIMVWRTNMFEYLGEASLGYWPGFNVDGIRIENGYPAYFPLPRGSGVTCMYPYGDTPYKLMQTMVHELGHWLLGKLHPYDSESLGGKHAYWGLLCSNQRVASCVNAYERERLGWITVPEIQPDQNVQLSDFVSAGVAYKYHPPNGEAFEFFYIENHQKLSVFDDATANPNDKGIWILHQQAPYSEEDNFRMKPSDGSWRWRNPVSTTQCSAQALPVFEKGIPYPPGLSHRDQIPNAASALNWLQAFQDSAGQLRCGRFSMGESFTGAFNTNSIPVFSPYSNPNTNTWANQQTSFSLEILNEINGVVTARYNSQPLDASPARRYLGADATIQAQQPDWIYLGWGEQWSEGQQVEADVNWSELERKIENGGEWASMYQGPSRSWSDGSVAYDTNGTIRVLFRARVRDTQGKYSAWSNIYVTAVRNPNSVEVQAIPEHFALGTNYPNPFNPTTTIFYQLPVESHVTLTIYNLLGQEMKSLVRAQQPAGNYSAEWNGSMNSGNMAISGVYFYKLEATASGHSPFTSVKRMLMLK